METDIADYTGYLASLFIVLSFIMKDLRKIRLTNLVGCLLFVLYGVLKGNGIVSHMYWPVIIPNAVLMCIQVYYLAAPKNK